MEETTGGGVRVMCGVECDDELVTSCSAESGAGGHLVPQLCVCGDVVCAGDCGGGGGRVCGSHGDHNEKKQR